ncbi:AAA family ATPase [Hymenobacter metallilatus]|uniref:ATP-binding protein n=1 Tax=Hymenobacter metallilatus TaxID=2493666 RepID=A0A428JT05_9BACT|nr:AAA family ATPase [Hymenobacter metallilatus]RSK37219.1 ATP-binding protein [Hymenobacter metallilatus]
MIKSLKVESLNGKLNLDLRFNHDLNILTGKNGTGKTTILKLIWYLNAGYFSQIFTEITFEKIEFNTDSNYVRIYKNSNNEKNIKNEFDYTVVVNDAKYDFGKEPLSEMIRYGRDNGFLSDILRETQSSLFFPTFRRIEGGFAIERNRHDDVYGGRYNLKESLSNISERLSNNNHKFIASLSTEDLTILITKKYAEITEIVNSLQKRHSDSIIDRIRKRKYGDVTEDTKILESIKRDIEQMEVNRMDYYKSFTAMSSIIAKVFGNKGIKIKNLKIGIGDISNAISSEKLSAGEKQMLSFLCYNTFNINHAIFIDEPELSLHPDWQRILVPVLMKQESSNQFFMATHSPFIYARFPDKEIIVDDDKGDEELIEDFVTL